MMIGKILMTVLMISQFVTPSHSSNIKLLDIEVDRWASRVWEGRFIREDDIKNSITFLYSLEGIDDKYLNPTSFNSYYEKAVSEIQNTDQVTGGYFPKFASLCKKLYEETPDTQSKVGFYMLFEGVTKKHLKQVLKAKSLMAKKNSDNLGVSNTFSDSLDLFKRFFDGAPDSSTIVK